MPKGIKCRNGPALAPPIGRNSSPSGAILDVELFRVFVQGLDLRLQLIVLVIPGGDNHLPLIEFLLHFVVL
jgi:hypothetical protein